MKRILYDADRVPVDTLLRLLERQRDRFGDEPVHALADRNDTREKDSGRENT